MRELLAFLAFDQHAAALRTLAAPQLEACPKALATRYGRSGLRHAVAHLRGFLRFLANCDEAPPGLDTRIDRPRTYRDEHLPRALPWATGQVFLATISRARAVGHRAYALCLLMATYGLRASEVAALRLDSVRWRVGERRVPCSKGCIERILPLTAEVGNAVLDYLRHGRPASPLRALFLRCLHPLRAEHQSLLALARGGPAHGRARPACPPGGFSMRTPAPTFRSALGPAIAAYLALPCALGYQYGNEARILAQFDGFLADRRDPTLTAAGFDAWIGAAAHGSPATRRIRMRVVHNLCLDQRRTDPRCFVPDPQGFPPLGPTQPPFILTERHVWALLRHAARLPATLASPLRPAVYRLAIVLLYTAGLRRGELARLTLADCDLAQGTLRVQASKFRKSRLVALSADARHELQGSREQQLRGPQCPRRQAPGPRPAAHLRGACAAARIPLRPRPASPLADARHRHGPCLGRFHGLLPDLSGAGPGGRGHASRRARAEAARHPARRSPCLTPDPPPSPAPCAGSSARTCRKSAGSAALPCWPTGTP